MSKPEVRKLISISEDTYDRLKKIGRIGDTFDSLIARLLTQTDNGHLTRYRQLKGAHQA